MMGHKTVVAKRSQDLQPKAYPTHCHGHLLSSSVKDTTGNYKLLSDTMGTAKEIVSLIKFFSITSGESPGVIERKHEGNIESPVYVEGSLDNKRKRTLLTSSRCI